MIKKQIYNLNSNEESNEAKIINGNPSGIINFTNTNHKWANSIWDLMLSFTWFPEEVNMTLDKKPYAILSEPEKKTYDLVLSQLISNDSIQTNQLMDSINQYVTSGVVNAVLSRQAYEEALHSKSYAVMVEDISGDSERIYNMHKHDEQLTIKNQAVADMYANINDKFISTNDILKAFAANNILEGIVFMGGFVAMWSLGNKMTSSAKMISFIHRDEAGTHVPLFKNIFNTAYKEVYPGNRNLELDIEIFDMIQDMSKHEKTWTKYATKGILGFSDKAIDMYIDYCSYQVMKNLHIDYLWLKDKPESGPLKIIEDKYSLLSSKTKANFFEGSVADYSIGTIKDDEEW
ncbi:MAG: ribonucleotide-diphosphate reductase subunit beta [Clostridiales bacterium]|nr:ribonucleotide-diphosphate reductase subunit beta [Clostridiales bacterium]